MRGTTYVSLYKHPNPPSRVIQACQSGCPRRRQSRQKYSETCHLAQNSEPNKLLNDFCQRNVDWETCRYVHVHAVLHTLSGSKNEHNPFLKKQVSK